MENILNTYFPNSAKDKTDVEVLLGTYNGGKYIEEFLESLKNQKNVRIHLKVSDDGSTDNTLEILFKYSNFFASFKLQDGPQQGAAINYFNLIENSTLEYIALADQDDIWYENHLENSINRLRNFVGSPALTYSTMEQQVGNELKLWPKIPYVDLQNFIFENHCRGCTIVFNRNFKDQIYYRNENSIMHDWWLALLAADAQVLYCSKSPEIYYRIHKENSVGLGPKFFVRMINVAKQFLTRNWGLLNQLATLSSNSRISKQHNFDSDDFVAAMTGHFKLKRFFYILYPGRFRSNLLDEIVLRLLFSRRWEIGNLDLYREGS
jgi:glycosyltransferase involved in cell wall biosynthesis